MSYFSLKNFDSFILFVWKLLLFSLFPLDRIYPPRTFALSCRPRLFHRDHLSLQREIVRSTRIAIYIADRSRMDRRIDSATERAKSVRVIMATGENCATKESIESPGQFLSYMAKENSHWCSRRFQFPPMWPYIERNAGRSELIPTSKRHGAASLLPGVRD